MQIYDAAMSFRAPGATALVATQSVGELPLDKMVNARPSDQKNKLGAKKYAVTVFVESLAFVTEDDPDAIPPTVAESYTINVLTGEPGSADVVVGTLVPQTTGTYEIVLDSATIEKLDPARSVVELSLVAAGDAPEIRFASWIV